jgi:hypothetical protein
MNRASEFSASLKLGFHPVNSAAAHVLVVNKLQQSHRYVCSEDLHQGAEEALSH